MQCKRYTDRHFCLGFQNSMAQLTGVAQQQPKESHKGADTTFAGGREIQDVADMKAAAADLQARGAALVLVKGGHLAGTNGRAAVDVACDGANTEELESEVVRSAA